MKLIKTEKLEPGAFGLSALGNILCFQDSSLRYIFCCLGSLYCIVGWPEDTAVWLALGCIKYTLLVRDKFGLIWFGLKTKRDAWFGLV